MKLINSSKFKLSSSKNKLNSKKKKKVFFSKGQMHTFKTRLVHMFKYMFSIFKQEVKFALLDPHCPILTIFL